MSHSLLYDMSARPDSVSNFSHGWARVESFGARDAHISMQRPRRTTLRRNGPTTGSDVSIIGLAGRPTTAALGQSRLPGLRYLDSDAGS